MLTRALTDITEALTAGGVQAVFDPRDLVTPGVLVQVRELEYSRMDNATVDVVADLWLIATNSGPALDAQQLDDLAAQVRTVFPARTFETAVFTLGNHAPDNLPGLKTTIHLTIGD